MTGVIVNSGICGFSVRIMVVMEKDKKIHVFLETECEMVKRMLEDISILDMRAAFSGFARNPVYRSAAMHLRHVACPVPCGILKAVEVEAGVCIPRDVSIVFEDHNQNRGIERGCAC